MRNIIQLSFIFLLMLFACGPAAESPATVMGGGSVKDGGYELTDIQGTNAKSAVLKDEEGKILEEGVLSDGVQEGTWLYYNVEKAYPVKMVSYVNGAYNGPYMEFNESGSITLATYYVNNKLHGHWTKYRFGRIESDANYRTGELDGLFREFNFRDGKIKKEIYYKAGLQDGPMRFYDENENMTIEFVYKNGEKVSGGSE